MKMDRFIKMFFLTVILFMVYGSTKAQICTQTVSLADGTQLIHRQMFGCCAGYENFGGEESCKECLEWTYGSSCTQACQCVRESTRLCHPVDGTCLCQPYWTGEHCEIQQKLNLQIRSVLDENLGEPASITLDCMPWFYGTNCTEQCSCNQTNAVSCNSTDGSCICEPGYTGAQCNEACIPWYYGTNCTHQCSCNQTNTVTCTNTDGNCICKDGYTGNVCNDACSNFTFGANCANTCLCNQENTQTCNPVDGSCTCLTGWQGETCNETCNNGTHGDQCSLSCSCPANAYMGCHHITGACTCLPGYGGDMCTSSEEGSILTIVRTVLENPVYVGVASVIITLVLVALVLCILWKVFRCSCAELKQRYRRQEKDSQKSEDTVINDNKNYAAIAALAAVTSQLQSQDVQESNIDNTTTVYGAHPVVTGKPPIDDGKSENDHVVAPPSPASVSTFNLHPKRSVGSIAHTDITQISASSVPNYDDSNDSPLSTFKLSSDTRKFSKPELHFTVQPFNYNNNVTSSLLSIPQIQSQPELKMKSSIDAKPSFDDVIASLSKQPNIPTKKSRLYKRNYSQSQPDINSNPQRPVLPFKPLERTMNSNSQSQPSVASAIDDNSTSRFKPAPPIRLYNVNQNKNSISNPNLSINSKNDESVYEDIAIASSSTDDVKVEVADQKKNKPSDNGYAGYKRKQSLVPIPVAPPVVNFEKPPEAPSVANIPKPIYGNDDILSKPLSYQNNKGIPPPVPFKLTDNVKKQSDSTPSSSQAEYGNNAISGNTSDMLQRQPSENIYEEIEGPGISRFNRFSSGVYAELT